ncbi:MAG: hypothetical protein KME09_07730 [Pleurocapsa minor HA4230-MV1]|jgi:hypothetical protein|nr:hypothetical protein [Pleurocapsa minor HA4230-MV1]
MKVNRNLEDRVVEKVRSLSIEQVEQVEQFIDLLNEQKLDSQLTLVSTKMSESVFNKVWNNPEDVDYDQL